MCIEDAEDPLIPGFKLRSQLQGHSREIHRLAWSPDGRFLATPSSDSTIRVWDWQSGNCYQTIEANSECYSATWSPAGRVIATGHADNSIHFWDTITWKLLRTIRVPKINGCKFVSWSPDGNVLASYSLNPAIQLWDMRTGEHIKGFGGLSGGVNSIAWSPNGQILAGVCLSDIHRSHGKILLWDTNTWNLLNTFEIPYSLYSVAWSPDGQTIFTGASDQTIRIWDLQTGHQKQTLEGLTSAVTSIAFSYPGHFLASKSFDGTVCIWRTSTWEMILTLEKPTSRSWSSSLAFHPKEAILATPDKEDREMHLWELDIETLLKVAPINPSIQYANAKVVLVGDSGVGKTGLSLVLTKQPFRPTESTHGRQVWTIDTQKVEYADGQTETREILLWDLAGQPGYRLVHQLHLNDVSLTLVVFDAHDEADPFAGVEYWNRAIRMAQSLKDNTSRNLTKFLVAARFDRGGKNVSRERINMLLQEMNFDRYFETSAKESWGIEELAQAIREMIDWNKLPKVVSTDLFQRIKAYLITEKEDGRLMATIDDLYRSFLKSKNVQVQIKDLYLQFEACIRRLESTGLIKCLSFGNLVLLRPELLDGYASAMVTSVKDEPDGLGSISEEKARLGDFRMSIEERLEEKEQEKLLLIAMIEDLLRRDIVLREESYLVFPSQSTRDFPELTDPEGMAVVFSYEGPIMNIYSTLAVRLANCGLFVRKATWRNAITYTARAGGTCGIFLRNLGEGRGELVIFFDESVSEQTRFHFDDFVHTHLVRHSIPASVQRRRIFICYKCATAFTDKQVMLRRGLGFNLIRCSVCDTEIALNDWEKLASDELTIIEMDRQADVNRELETATSILQGKIATSDFDVFISYNSRDKIEVQSIGKRLRERGILPWLDVWELLPGFSWQSQLQKQIGQIRSAAIFVGRSGLGTWELEELEAILNEFIKLNRPIIPVILSDVIDVPKMPMFLRSRHWVDFRKETPDPLGQLIWGITGKKDLEQFLRQWGN